MTKSLFLRLLTLFLVLSGTLSYADMTDEQIKRQNLKAIEEINKTYQPIISLQALPTFPSGHPATAISGTSWSWASKGLNPDLFNSYVWRENGEVWIEIEIISNDPFICSSSFAILQNGIQYDTVRLDAFSGSNQCGDLYISSIFRLTQWSHFTNAADLNKAFTLIYEGVWDNYSLNIPAGISAPTPDPSLGLFYQDYDSDGYGNSNQSISASSQPYGYVSNNTDCNDNDSGIYPGATEIAGDGIDQDCNGSDLTISKTWYQDYDSDGYGNSNQSISASSQPYGYVSNNTDCNDNDSGIYPGATEIAGDGIDQDCNGSDKVSTGSSSIAVFEDFNNGQSGGFTEDDRFSVVNNALLFQGKGTNLGYIASWSGGVNPGGWSPSPGQSNYFEDFNVSVDVSWKADADDVGYGLLVCTQKNNIGGINGVRFHRSNNGHYIITKLNNGKLIGVVLWTQSSLLKTNSMTKLSIVKVGNNFRFFIDLQEVYQSDIYGYNGGGLGVESNDQLSASFDNFKVIDLSVSTPLKTWYQDKDGDGYGNPNQSLSESSQPYGYVSNKTDCNDNDSSIHPGATEIAGDGIDQDCNGADYISTTVPSIDTAVANGTKIIQTFISAGNDIGKVGDVYVFRSGQYYTGSNWTTSKKPYLAGVTLGTTSVTYDVAGLPTGTKIYVGYGVGVSGTYLSMNTNATFVLAYTTVATTSTGNSITIKSDLSFSIPDALYQSLTGSLNLWLDFKFFVDPSGKLLWELADYGDAISTGNHINILPDLSFSIPNAIYQSLTGDINLETNFIFFGDQSGKLLWELDSYTIK